MDNRRLNTGQVLTADIMNLPPPKSAVPADSVRESVDE
jgi:hypothetical protein